MRRLVAGVITALVISTGAAQARVEHSSAACTDADPGATAALNALIADPWGPVSAQRTREAQESLHALEGKRFVDAHGGGTLNWLLWAKTTNVDTLVSLSRPPGFQRVSEDCFDVRAPLSNSWRFGFTADIPERARVRIGGENIFSVSPTGHIQLTVTGNVAGHVELDRSQPERPSLRSATLTPAFQIGVNGLFSLNVSIPAKVLPDGTIELRRELVDVGFDFGSLSASFDGDLIITLKPTGYISGAYADLQHDVGSDVRKNAYIVGDTVAVQSAFQAVDIRLAGKLKAKLKRVGTVTAPWSLTIPATIPSSGELIELQQVIARSGLPIRWGDKLDAPNILQKDTRSTAEFGAEARTVEQAALKHLPWDNVVSLIPDPRGKNNQGTLYSGQKDSAIWTGHYLAAEAFRYASTRETEALEHVRKAVTGLERLFDAPARGAAHTGPNTRADLTAERGVLARTAVPSTADKWDEGALAGKKCWYEWPEKGWLAGGRRYATYADVPKGPRQVGRDGVRPDQTGTIWHAWGCGDTWPVSRDQYIGVMFGLGSAWLLVDDPGVKERARRLIDDALSYLVIRHHWTITLPPDGRIQTDFIGDFPKQLALLRLGATVMPAKYGGLYAKAAAAARHMWIPVWFSGTDPLMQYYKFNLSNAAFALGLLYETGGPRNGFLYGHDILWGAVRHHRNAYFDLLRVLAHGKTTAKTPSWLNPKLTLQDEIVTVLAEWIDRRVALKAGRTSELPVDDMSAAAISFQQLLFPSFVGRYKGVELTETWQASSALPVDARTGSNMDFVWQRQPFNVGIPNARATPTRPTADEIHDAGAKKEKRLRESPGVDYLLPYWLAVYLGVLPKPS